jgi:hypothetical protein
MVRTILVRIFLPAPSDESEQSDKPTEKRGSKVRFGAEGYTVAIQLSKV